MARCRASVLRHPARGLRRGCFAKKPNTTESRTFADRLALLLRDEQHALADFLVALAEFDRQRAWLELGYSGLWSTSDRPEPLSLQPAPDLRVEPFTPTETRLHLTVPPEFLEKLEAARLALSHSMPGASEMDVLSAGLDLILGRADKQKALVAKPRSAPADAPAEPGARYIPAAVRREVWKRDQGCCQYPLDGGGVCGSRLRLEIDHIDPRCRGGKPIASKLRITCGFHNLLAARQALGDAVMNRYTRDPRRPRALAPDATAQPGAAS